MLRNDSTTTTTLPLASSSSSSNPPINSNNPTNIKSQTSIISGTSSPNPPPEINPNDISSPHELIGWVDNVLGKLEAKFDRIEHEVIERLDVIGKRINSLELSLNNHLFASTLGELIRLEILLISLILLEFLPWQNYFESGNLCKLTYNVSCLTLIQH
ncbi:hypothetical protein O181_006567 [Austropuccinia psidii MF-1]|uniref:Uncharacterized protein n=1 Tax=Austropuccinia psidii MF-1 TaxID=1389203 RepID=A0A9Q3BK95_9BASI|nr:hypothetical protein [Austropuccinia psidii MF-1]